MKKKKRISSFIYWFTPIFIDIFFFVLFIKFLFNNLNSNDKYFKLFSIFVVFFWLILRVSFRFKTVFIDDNFLYIFRYLGYKKIELSNVKSVKEKRIFPFKSTNTYVIKYLDASLNLKKIKIYGSFSNRYFLENFIVKINTQNK